MFKIGDRVRYVGKNEKVYGKAGTFVELHTYYGEESAGVLFDDYNNGRKTFVLASNLAKLNQSIR